MAAVRNRLEEQMRRVAARATEEVARRQGTELGMALGCGYPKSGTVWLCQMMGAYLGVPYPQNYLLPVAMKSVIHAHWRYDERFPSTGYIVRDGRDVMVSLYFYEMRALTLTRNPSALARRQAHFRDVLGPGFEPDDARGNLPRFMEAEFSKPRALRGVTWAEHVAEWTAERRPNVTVVTYEDLLEDAQGAFGALMAGVTGEEADPERVELAVRRFAFDNSGRAAGTEDRTSFMRKGIRGDWRNHFSREAGEIFERHAGDMLRAHGYESGNDWVGSL